MTAWLDVSQRCCEPENIDDPALDRQRHAAALRGLARINHWSRSVHIVWSAIRRLVRETGVDELRVLDIATGAGDVPIGLIRRARRTRLKLQVAACDLSPRALEYAQRQTALAGVDVQFFQADALGDDLPGDYDVLATSLFLHHLSNEAAGLLLKKMATAARRLVVVNDLARSRSGLLLAYWGSRILSRSDDVHLDAERSVRAAFTLDEVRALAAQARLPGATVSHCFPRRFVLTWGR
jgi:SAM-dependent methyltransferase